MPAGATALDFAFTIHTFVGSHCIGAKVNHRLVSMSHQLKSGDQVEILTSKTQHVTRAWLNMATTAKAKTKILGILRREEREIRRKGEEMLDQFLEKNEITRDTPSIERLCRLHEFSKSDELFYAIGSGNLQLDTHDADVLLDRASSKSGSWRRLFTFGRKNKKDDATPNPSQGGETASTIDRKKVIVLDDESIQQRYTLSECCKPIPGDPVMGYIDDGGRIVIHKLQCPIAMRLKANHGNRVLAARWNMQQRNLLFPVSISLQGIDRLGLLNEMTQIISQQHSINMHKLVVEAGDGIFTCDIQLFVHDTSEINDLIRGLADLKDIKSVVRM
jgi:GTP pyrophosphokinase